MRVMSYQQDTIYVFCLLNAARPVEIFHPATAATEIADDICHPDLVT